MVSRRNKRFYKTKKNKANKNKTYKTYKKDKWTTAVGSAENVYRETGSYEKARDKLRSQAIINARRLFGSVTERLYV